MRVGVSVKPVFTIDGQIKEIDGIGTYTYNLCQSLKDNTIDLKQVYFKRIKESFCRSRKEKNSFYVCQNPLYLNYAPLCFDKQMEKNIDVLHVTDYFIPRLKQTPVISTLHDAILLKHPNWDAILLKHPNWMDLRLCHFKGSLFKHSAKYADHIIAVSQAMVSDIVNYWRIPEEKISVVYSGLSDSWFQEIDHSIKEVVLQKYGLSHQSYLLCVGTLQPKKNIERLMEAYLNLPLFMKEAFRLVIVGKQYPGLTRQTLLDKIGEYEEKGFVRWLRYVPFKDLLCLYQGANMLLFPSLEEGFGLPILEGFASKIPVITSDFGATAEISGDSAYLVDSYSMEALTEAMKTLIDNKELRQTLINKGYRRAQEFSWDKCAKNTIEIYKKFI